MTRLRPDQVNDWITGKANAAFSRHIQMDQGRLAKANPKDTGRMAASWRIGSPNADPSTEPEDYSGDGTPRKYSGLIKMNGRWHVSNNVPYAQRVALDPKWAKGGKGGAAWFTSISNASASTSESDIGIGAALPGYGVKWRRRQKIEVKWLWRVCTYVCN